MDSIGLRNYRLLKIDEGIESDSEKQAIRNYLPGAL